MRAWVYVRQSKAKNDSISPEVQEYECRQYAARRGYTVVKVVSDLGVTGYSKEWRKRPNFPRVAEASGRGEVDVVLVYRWSRLSRRRKDQVELIDLLGRVESATEPFDVSTAAGRLSRDQMLLFSSFESDLKSEQIREAHARRLRKGLTPTGKGRFGYDHPSSEAYVPNADGELLRKAYERYVAGEGFVALAQWMTKESSRSFSSHSLAKVMDSGFTAGYLLYKGFHKGAHPAVVPEETWRAYLDARERRKKAPPARRGNVWVMTDLAVCEGCGHNVHRAQAFARCAFKARGGNCPSAARVRLADLDIRIANWVAAEMEELAARLPQRAEEREEARRRTEADSEALNRVLGALGGLLARELKGEDKRVLDAARSALEAEKQELTDRLAASRGRLEALGAEGDLLSVFEESELGASEWREVMRRQLGSRRFRVGKGTVDVW